MNLDTIHLNNYTCAFHTVSKCILWKGSSGHGKKCLIWFQFWLFSEAHAALWPAMLGVWKLFHDMEAEMFSVPLAESGDRDRWALFGWRGHLAASIRTDQSLTLLSLCPLTKRCPLKHWAVRWEVTLIAPLRLLFSMQFPPFLSIKHCDTSFSLSSTLLQWLYGLLIWLEERSLVDHRCHCYQAHTCIAAAHYTSTQFLCSPEDIGGIFMNFHTKVWFIWASFNTSLELTKWATHQ